MFEAGITTGFFTGANPKVGNQGANPKVGKVR
jgi:hypothetical protein